MLSRSKIIGLTKATTSRVLSNEVGVAPKKKKHVQRLAKLKSCGSKIGYGIALLVSN